MSAPAYLALETGQIVEGRCRAPGTAHGELVFTTAYTGYEESLTDPSYAKQVLTFAYPLIGNYGVRADRFESSGVQPEAAIAREFDDPVPKWLETEGVPAIDHLDTRALVRQLRDHGAMRCGIAAGPDVTPVDAEAELAQCRPIGDYDTIGDIVTTDEHRVHNTPIQDSTTVALLDCGVKRSIIDEFTARGATVHQLPVDTPVSAIENLDPDIVFISNGPGNPETYTNALTIVDEYLGDRPLAGICLGQQIIALATGGTTEKMRFGHRGVNQPVYDRQTDQVVMTTQNHGYTVADTGPLSITQHNVNDGSAEGLASSELDVITRQYHPEANPGPRDTLSFFDQVLALATDSLDAEQTVSVTQ